jgi:hypothetical protein
VYDLTTDDLALLDFADLWWPGTAARKRLRSGERFGLHPTRYYQRLNALIDHPEAVQRRPPTVHRLRKGRERRRQRRPGDTDRTAE